MRKQIIKSVSLNLEHEQDRFIAKCIERDNTLNFSMLVKKLVRKHFKEQIATRRRARKRADN
jgi:hypothetical protein